MPRPHLAHAKKRGLGTRLGLGSEYEAAGLNDMDTDEKRYLNVLKSQSLNHPPACVEEEGGGGGLTLTLTQPSGLSFLVEFKIIIGLKTAQLGGFLQKYLSHFHVTLFVYTHCECYFQIQECDILKC